MCRRPLAGFFSRMCTGTPMASPNCPAAAQTRQCVWMSLLQEGLACCLCPVVSSGHALRAVQPASESACSFLFLVVRFFSFNLLYIPSVHLLYLLLEKLFRITPLPPPSTCSAAEPTHPTVAQGHNKLAYKCWYRGLHLCAGGTLPIVRRYPKQGSY